MTSRNDHVGRRMPLRLAAVASLLGGLLLAPAARADHEAVTLQQIADQILGVTAFPPGNPSFVALDLTCAV